MAIDNFKPRQVEGALDGKGLNLAIIVSRFNDFITERLLDGALDALKRHGAKAENIEIYRTPGTFEIPVALKRILDQQTNGKNKKSYDTVICLGAVIRGATPHFDYIAAEVTKGIAKVSLDYCLPVAYGILTCDTIEQAVERAGTKAGNKGWDAAMSAIEMAQLFKQ